MIHLSIYKYLSLKSKGDDKVVLTSLLKVLAVHFNNIIDYTMIEKLEIT